MDLQKIASTGTAIAVVGTGTVVGGNHIIDQQTGGPAKRREAEVTELRQIVSEEVKKALWEVWPTKTGGVKGMIVPTDYKKEIPK